MVLIPTGSDQKLKKVPFITIIIILINIAAHYYIKGMDYKHQREIIRAYGWVLNEAGPVRLFTCMFIHGSFYHLLGNMVFLWAFGSYLETIVGGKKYLAYYIGGGLAATALHSIFVSIFRSPAHASIPCIGASGAISGIMGVYLVRCYFTKIKMAISIFGPFYFVPKRLKVNAVALIGFYLLMNLYNGFKSLDSVISNVAYWAHIGGLVFGIGVSLCSRHLRLAVLDNKRLCSRKWIEKDIGLGKARQDLEEILKDNPEEVKVLIDLARMESRYRLESRGEKLYKKAILILWKQGEKDYAADVFIEFFRKYQKIFQGPLQLQICRTMINKYQYDLAARVLEVMIEEAKANPRTIDKQVLEQTYILLGRLLADKLNFPEPATNIFREFLKRFPRASQREMVTQKLRLLEAH